MSDTTESVVSTLFLHPDRRMFPVLTAAQMSRIATIGRIRSVQRGEVLVEVL